MSTRPSHNDSCAVVEHFDRLSATGDWSRLYEVADGFTYHFHVRRARVLELLPARLGRVVDVGCGPGVMVEAVLSRGGTFDGVDLSPDMVAEARRINPDIEFHQGDMLSLPDRDESWGGIAAFYCIIHIPRDKIVDALHEMTTAPDSHVYVHCVAGLVRSPTILWLYLIACGVAWQDAREWIQKRSPMASAGSSRMVDREHRHLAKQHGRAKFLPLSRPDVIAPCEVERPS